MLGEIFPSRSRESIFDIPNNYARRARIGTYDPIPKPAPLGVGKPFKDIQLDTARAKYWLGVGAQPSDPAWRLLSMVCHSMEALPDLLALADGNMLADTSLPSPRLDCSSPNIMSQKCEKRQKSWENLLKRLLREKQRQSRGHDINRNVLVGVSRNLG